MTECFKAYAGQIYRYLAPKARGTSDWALLRSLLDELQPAEQEFDQRRSPRLQLYQRFMSG